jgi:hypothetical protein
MPARKSPPLDDPDQIERFKALARELDCDESEEAFDAALKELAEAGPPPKYEPKKRSKRVVEHASDCEVHNAPAHMPGRCACGAATTER